MDYGKSTLANDVVGEDFGRKVVLNTISPSSLRRINKINVGGNQKISNEQLPLESDIDGFGFDIDRDLVGTITGQSNDDNFAHGIMTGSDQLNLTVTVDVQNLSKFPKMRTHVIPPVVTKIHLDGLIIFDGLRVNQSLTNWTAK